MNMMKTSMTEIPVCPREHFSSYKTLFRLVPCYKRDWATCCTVATTCYLLLFACYISPRYTITCYRYFQCLQLLPCWNPFIRAFCSSFGLEIPVCPREHFSSYKTLFRLVPCYKRDWATCCTVATTCYLLLFACYISPRYTITCYRYFQCLQLLPCWNPFIRAFCSSFGLSLVGHQDSFLAPLPGS